MYYCGMENEKPKDDEIYFGGIKSSELRRGVAGRVFIASSLTTDKLNEIAGKYIAGIDPVPMPGDGGSGSKHVNVIKGARGEYEPITSMNIETIIEKYRHVLTPEHINDLRKNINTDIVTGQQAEMCALPNPDFGKYPYVEGVVPLSEIGKIPEFKSFAVREQDILDERKAMRRFKLRKKRALHALSLVSVETQRELGLFNKVNHQVLNLAVGNVPDMSVADRLTKMQNEVDLLMVNVSSRIK